jgi:hypothetical protein
MGMTACTLSLLYLQVARCDDFLLLDLLALPGATLLGKEVFPQ